MRRKWRPNVSWQCYSHNVPCEASSHIRHMTNLTCTDAHWTSADHNHHLTWNPATYHIQLSTEHLIKTSSFVSNLLTFVWNVEHREIHPKTLIQARWVSCFHVLYTKFWHYSPISCCLILASPCEPFSVFSWVPPSVDLCCSSPSGWECYTCRDAVLHTFVVMSVVVFFSYFLPAHYSLPILFCPLISTRHFHQENCPSLDTLSQGRF